MAWHGCLIAKDGTLWNLPPAQMPEKSVSPSPGLAWSLSASASRGGTVNRGPPSLSASAESGRGFGREARLKGVGPMSLEHARPLWRVPKVAVLRVCAGSAHAAHERTAHCERTSSAEEGRALARFRSLGWRQCRRGALVHLGYCRGSEADTHGKKESWNLQSRRNASPTC